MEVHFLSSLGTRCLHLVVAERQIALRIHALQTVKTVFKGVGTQRGEDGE